MGGAFVIFAGDFYTILHSNSMSRKQNVQSEASTSRSTGGEITIPAYITPKRVAAVASIVALGLYAMTLNRTFGFIDKGELVAVASTLGIAHPTGYPTIMILGFLLTSIVPLREVLTLNIASALLTGASVGVMTMLFVDLLGRIGGIEVLGAKGLKGRKGPKGGPVEGGPGGGARALYAGIGALMVGCSSTWWDQANGFEVYSLHALFMPLVILLFLRHCDREAALFQETSGSGSVENRGDGKGDGRGGNRDDNKGVGAGRFTREGFLFALVLGLSFTNHLTTILMAPALLFYYFRVVGSLGGKTWGTMAYAFKRLLVLVAPFLLGLLPYIWLPIRASMGPEFNWGNPSDLDRLVNHIGGKQYQVWFQIFRYDAAGNLDWSVFKAQSGFFFGGLSAQLGYIGLAAVLVGIVQLVRRKGVLALAVGLLFLTCIAWSGNYEIMEIGPYYMTAMIALGIFGVSGLHWLHERFGTTAAVAFGGILLLLSIGLNYGPSDESGNTMVEDMTRNVLENAPQKSLIISSMWDYWVAGSFYMQGVEDLRRDVIVIDQELLRRSWYLDQLAHNHPEFMARVKEHTEQFRKQVYKFEHDIPYNPTEIDFAYYGLINAMIDSNVAERPVLLTAELPEQIGKNYQRVPTHLLYRLVADSTYQPETFPTYHFTPLPGRIDYYTAKTHQLYAANTFDRASYEHTHGHDSLAKRYLDYAIGFDPGFTRKEIPSLPLRSNEQVLGVIEFFERLHTARGGR
jgi:hypothetical protein